MTRSFSVFVYFLTAAFFACFFLWPIMQTLQGAFFDLNGHFTFEFIAAVFQNPIYLEGLYNAFLLAAASTMLTILIALPLAFMSDRFLFPGKGLLAALILVPMILPPFVGAIGVKQILGEEGSLNALLIALQWMSAAHPIDWLGSNRFLGIILMNALHLYPILYLNTTAVLANIDPAMEEAAENLGCTGIRKFFKITLPLIMPGLFAGGTI
ncbi:MAG: ABC transporter permease subunit, partial [Chthoniobacterales bacterium]